MPGPLTPHIARLASDFLRALAARHRLLRCFPQWPPPVDPVTAAYALLDQVPEIVVDVDSGLAVNGVPLRTAPEFEALLHLRAIRSLTFRAGVQPAELDALTGPHVEALAGQRSPLPPPPGERPLEVDELDRLFVAIRHWKNAADYLKLHPPGDSATAAALGLASSAMISLVSLVPRVTFSVPGGPLLVNSEPVSARHAAPAIAFLANAFVTRGIRAITIWQGLEIDECHALVSLIAVNDRIVADRLRTALDGHHVAFDMPVPGSTESDHGLPSFPTLQRDTEILPLDPLETEREEETDILDLRAKFLLKAPGDRFLSTEAEHEFAPALESLHKGTSTRYANRLVDRLAVYLADPEARWRSRAHAVLAQALRETRSTSCALLVVRIRPAISASIAAETEPGVLSALADTVVAWMGAALNTWPLQVPAEFVFHDLRKRLERDPEWKATLLQRTGTLAPLDPVFKALRSGPAPLREAAVRVASIVGAPLTPRLVDFIVASDDVDARRAAAQALRETGGQAELARFASEDAPRAIRALSVLDAAGPAIESAVIAAVGRSEPAVREAGFALIRRLDPKIAAPILRRTLGLEPLATLATATRMSLADLLPEVVGLAGETLNDAHAFAACSFLAAVPSPTAIPALRRIFEQRSKMFGFKKGLSDATRAAAVSAAARLAHADAKALLEAARDDRSELVRNAAR